MNKFEFLNSITSQNASSLISNLQTIKEKILSDENLAKIDTSDLRAKLDESSEAANMIVADLERSATLLYMYQENADTQLLSLFLLIDRTILDYKSAYEASVYYDKNWFSNTLFSQEGKIKLAYHLMKAISVYCKDNIETLDMIANASSTMLQYIRYPRNVS